MSEAGKNVVAGTGVIVGTGMATVGPAALITAVATYGTASTGTAIASRSGGTYSSNRIYLTKGERRFGPPFVSGGESDQ